MALATAQTAASTREQAEEHVVVFRLGREHYAIDIGLVQEIIRMQPVSVIPEADYRLEGVTSFRGHVIPVLDMRRVCGVPADEETAESRMIVVSATADRVYGLIVDAVSEVLRIPGADVEPATGVVGNSRMIRGIAKLSGRLVALLGMDAVLPEGEFEAGVEVEAEAA